MKVFRMFLVMGVMLGIVACSQNVGAWEDYGYAWESPVDQISLPCVIGDADRFGEEGSIPSELPLYKMYYNPNWKGVHLATSPDGATWEYVDKVTDGRWPVVVYSAEGFGAGDAKYKMWYSAAHPASETGRQETSSFRVIESGDGLTWGEETACSDGDSQHKLVGGNGAWNTGSYGPERVFYNADGSETADPSEPMSNKYVMYYNVYGVLQEGGQSVGHSSVGLAVSADGVSWYSVGGEPVLKGSAGGVGLIEFADIARDSNGYVMNFTRTLSGSTHRIGEATSTDGVTWTVTSTDIEAVRPDDTRKPVFSLSIGYDPQSGELQMWRAVRDQTEGKVFLYYACEE